MLAVARGLMQNPKLLILDEITEGLTPVIVKQLEEIVQELIKRGVTILVAEQSVKFTLNVCHSYYILEKSNVVHNCQNEDLTDEIIAEFLGT